MRKIVLVLAVFFMLCSFAWADSYESITVAATAIGPTPATVGYATWGMCRCETAELRYTMDGQTTPTNLIGVIIEPMEWVILNNPDQIKNFKAIRTTGADGYLKCHYFQR
jgi:hypothetical protein